MSLSEFTEVPFLCQVCYLSDKYYMLELRKCELPPRGRVCFSVPYAFMCKADDFQLQVSRAFHLLSRFWLATIRNYESISTILSPVPWEVMIAASWIFGRDFSSKSAFYLRIVLSGFWGFDPGLGLSDSEAIQSMGRKMMPSLLCRGV